MQVNKQQLELDMEQQTDSKLGREYIKAIILSSCLFNLYVEYIMQNARLNEAQAGIKTATKISVALHMLMKPPLQQKAKI